MYYAIGDGESVFNFQILIIFCMVKSKEAGFLFFEAFILVKGMMVKNCIGIVCESFTDDSRDKVKLYYKYG